MKTFKFLNNTINQFDLDYPTARRYADRTINNELYGRLTITIPPAGLSHYQWNILPQDLKDAHQQEDMYLYLQGWEASRRGDATNPWDNPRIASMWNRGFTDYQMRIANPPRIRKCAVITASHRDFNNWKRSIFDMAYVQMINSGEFLHINGNNGVTTKYRAICYVQDCFGQMFNDYVITDRTNEILMRDYHDDYIINHINELINEVQRHTRR